MNRSKKARTKVEDPQQLGDPSVAPKDGEIDEQDSEEDPAKNPGDANPSVPTPDAPANKPYDIDGPGPYNFFLFEDELCRILNENCFDTNPKLVLVAAAMDSFKPVAHLPEDERDRALQSRAWDLVKRWDLGPVDDAETTPHAQALRALWDNHVGEGSESDGLDNDGGWYKVTFQRDKPKEGEAGLEVELYESGTWWFVKFECSNVEEHAVMTAIADIFSLYDY